jgi:hypothetical protein
MLTCPDSLAGKAGKCPHCQAKFRIPLPTAANTGPGSSPNAAAEVAPAAPATATATEAPVPPKSAVRAFDPDHDPAPKNDEIVFLCPEGHHLAGPATLAGEAEECPVCHTRFIVPNPDDIGEEESSTPEIALEQLLPAGEYRGGDDEVRGLGPLFAALWPYRSLGCPIELHLGEGRVLVPNGFVLESAQLSHGVFTVTEPNGASTLTVIAWSAIERVNVRTLYDMPRGLTVDAPPQQ